MRSRALCACVGAVVARAAILDVSLDVPLLTPVIAAAPAGIDRGAVISIHISAESEAINPVNVYVMSGADAEAATTQTLANPCALPAHAAYQAAPSLTVDFEAPLAARYAVLFVQCFASSRIPVSGTITISNPGAPYHYLDAESTRDYNTAMFYSAAYSLFAVPAVVAAALRRDSLTPFSILGSIALICRGLHWANTAASLEMLGQNGRPSTALKTAAVGLGTLSISVFLLQTLLMALGWRLLRTRLSRHERQGIAASFCVHVVLAVATASCTPGTTSCSAYELVEYVIRSLIMLATVVALNFNITHLRAATMHSLWTSTSHRLYVALAVLLPLRRYFLAFLLAPTLAFALDVSVFSWRARWGTAAVVEAITLAVFLAAITALYPAASPRLRCAQRALADATPIGPVWSEPPPEDRQGCRGLMRSATTRVLERLRTPYLDHPAWSNRAADLGPSPPLQAERSRVPRPRAASGASRAAQVAESLRAEVAGAHARGAGQRT